MLDNLKIATPLANNSNYHAIIQVIREELALIDPAKVLVYLFDTVDEVLLDLLAEQFDMLGSNGWVLADTAEQKRELLKSAYSLHAIKGTPGGIREVARRLGFYDIVIEENTGAPVDAANPWAYFKVKYVLGTERSMLENSAGQLAALINKYKNQRSILADFFFELVPVELVEIPEIVIVEIT